MMNTSLIRRFVCGAVALIALIAPRAASAQVDPLLFLKDLPPNVVLAVDTSARMLRDSDGAYYDPVEYRAANKS